MIHSAPGRGAVFRSLFAPLYIHHKSFLPSSSSSWRASHVLPPLEKSDEHPFPSVCLPIWIPFLFSRLRSSRPSSFARETDSQRTYCASFDRMRVYRQLSAGIAKFCVSVGEIESSLRGNVPGARAESDFYRFGPKKLDYRRRCVRYLRPRTYPHTRAGIKTQKRARCTRLTCPGLIMELLFVRHDRDFLLWLASDDVILGVL